MRKYSVSFIKVEYEDAVKRVLHGVVEANNFVEAGTIAFNSVTDSNTSQTIATIVEDQFNRSRLVTRELIDAYSRIPLPSVRECFTDAQVANLIIEESR